MLLVVTATHHELTVDRFGYGQAVMKKRSKMDDFADVKIFHTITSPPPDKQQLDPSKCSPLSVVIQLMLTLPAYTVCKYPETFFLVGQVFAIIDDWDMFHPKRGTIYPLPIAHSDMEYSRYAGLSIIRRYVVVQEGCIFEPDQDLHAIIHTSSESPPTITRVNAVYNSNAPYGGKIAKLNESGMVKNPVRMTVDHVSLALHPASRLHFGCVCRIEHDVRVKSLGVIHVDSIGDFIEYYKSAQKDVQAIFKVGRAVQKAANKLISGSSISGHLSEQKQPSGQPSENKTRNQAKAMAELKALCETNDAELFVIATQNSDSHRLNGLDEHPSCLRFKRGDRIKVLNNVTSPSYPTTLDDVTASNQFTTLAQRTTLDCSAASPESAVSDDLATLDATWWIGEVNGRQGEFPWWYCELEDLST
ncbi:MAG: hypothetical protein Q9187_008131 [Circinaria calcarea]